VALFEASLANPDVLPFDDDAARLAGRMNADLNAPGASSASPM
jgi:predicted nucleic acid-binding protein